MIYFVFSLLLFIYFIFLTSSNPYTLTMIFGKKGSGKTTFIAKWSLKYIKQGRVVYSNVPIMIPGVRLYNPKDIGQYTFEPGSVVFCDEVGLIWHNRDYKNFQKCVINWFKFQRQYKIKMYLFSQCFDTDKVLRDLTDKIYIINRLGKFSILRPIIKQVGISTDESGNGSLVDTYKYGSIFDYKFTYIPRYVGLFSSFNPPVLDYIRFSECNQSICFSDLVSWPSYLNFKFHFFFNNTLNSVKALLWRFRNEILHCLDGMKGNVQFWLKNIKGKLLCFCINFFNFFKK